MFWFALVPWLLGRTRDRDSSVFTVFLGLGVLCALGVLSAPVLVWRAADARGAGDPSVKITAVVSCAVAAAVLWMMFGLLGVVLFALAAAGVSQAIIERG